MEMADRINKRYNDADLACHLLKENRNAMHYKDIVVEVRKLRGKNEDPTPTEVAQILTQINLDSRFVHLGKGLWSLKDFSASVSRSVVGLDDEGIFIDGFDDEDILDSDAPEESDDDKEDDDDDEDVAVEVIPDDDTDGDLIEVVPLDDILAEEERDEDEDEHPEDL
jgi:DNA-directed RNA polymerase subunit delta